ncbi:helix-turn-helix domain-containing protein [Aquimarina longa]|uniref:helix-turn-helix domain-containing protein n=1 Tax=Aquimarina longa TaxID=1080221 RepID=UPI0007864221|nr:helix-turn-helix transcriptional regulator [Aquimarina longa]
MVNSKSFGNKIQKIMDYYGVSASSFADYMGVGRSSISHILSGRNKPSLDFVMKIVDAYTDVDLEWLLYEKGTFPKSDSIPVEEKKTILKSSDTFQEQVSTPIISSDQDLFSQSQSLPNEEDIQSPTPPIKKIPQIPSSDHHIDRIVIFYVDGTFNSYQMKP